MSMNARYVIVSPVKDEATHIELTLQSVVRQVHRPSKWVIVDDGSTDATADIVRRYAAEHSFIECASSGRQAGRQTGTAEAQAFKRGQEIVRAADYDFIVKLDGDLSFGADYFARLLRRFAEDPTLGIASGIYLETDERGQWQPVAMPPYHAFGACKVVRRDCFEQIGGFFTRPGWDSADEIKAWRLGWTTRHFSELEVRHHRREGSGMGSLQTSVMHGEIYYVTGGDPLLLPFKFVRRLSARPFVANACALAYGYFAALAVRKPRLVTRDEARGYRRVLRRRLFGRVPDGAEQHKRMVG